MEFGAFIPLNELISASDLLPSVGIPNLRGLYPHSNPAGNGILCHKVDPASLSGERWTGKGVQNVGFVGINPVGIGRGIKYKVAHAKL